MDFVKKFSSKGGVSIQHVAGAHSEEDEGGLMTVA